ncbi:nuclear transport factor 2 family protein [Myroides odoratus]|uniref:nuclear transport factor 2 family protein n=1 Tax=Myroides odoratus TaxID=256 RepID=UPI0039AEC233
MTILFFTDFQSFPQSAPEKELRQLSDAIFKWEVDNKIDSVQTAFHEKFLVIGSDGNVQLKNQYISKLKSGAFVHNRIGIEENNAVISGNSTVVSVTISGNKVQFHLSHIEVFTRENNKKEWKVLAMKASVIDK